MVRTSRWETRRDRIISDNVFVISVNDETISCCAANLGSAPVIQLLAYPGFQALVYDLYSTEKRRIHGPVVREAERGCSVIDLTQMISFVKHSVAPSWYPCLFPLFQVSVRINTVHGH